MYVFSIIDTHTVRSDGELNVLLVGSGDPRHILKTITGLRDSDTLHVRDSSLTSESVTYGIIAFMTYYHILNQCFDHVNVLMMRRVACCRFG